VRELVPAAKPTAIACAPQPGLAPCRGCCKRMHESCIAIDVKLVSGVVADFALAVIHG
jgi:hypothetical protein